MAVGIDHCRDGWCAAALEDSVLEIGIFSKLEEILKAFPQAQTIWIDMPVGLVTSARQCRPEPFARKILGRRSCTLFNVPCRQAINAKTYEEASDVNQRVLGRRLSRQSYGLFAGIREVDGWCRTHPDLVGLLHESHPELCFGVLAGMDEPGPVVNRPLQAGKHSAEGQQTRIELLSRWFSPASGFPDRWLDDPMYRKNRVDLLDALVLALCGCWSLDSGVQTIPDVPQVDDQGLAMQICTARWPGGRPDRG